MHRSCLLVLLLVLFVVPVTAAADTMFRANPEHTGVYDNGGIEPGNTELWRFDTRHWIVSSPTVSNGFVYVGSTDNNTYAIDTVTGKEKWRFRTGDVITSSPAVSTGVVYIGSGDGNLYAIDAATGTEKWRFNIGTLNVAPMVMRSSPVVSNSVVYAGGGGDGNLYAIDAATGTEKWRFAGGLMDSSPTVSNGVIYVGGEKRYAAYDLYAIDAVTGTEKWQFKTRGMIDSSPAVANGVVYVGSTDGNLYAIDAGTGTEKWRFAMQLDAQSSSPAVSAGVVYVGSGDGKLYAIDAVTGKEKWRFAMGNGVVSSPAVANGVVYVGSTDGNLYAIDAETGTEKWRFITVSGIFSSPSVANGVIYIGSFDYNLYAIGGATSTPISSSSLISTTSSISAQLSSPTSTPVSQSPDTFNPLIIIGIILLLCIGGGGYYVIHSRKSRPIPQQNKKIPAPVPERRVPAPEQKKSTASQANYTSRLNALSARAANLRYFKQQVLPDIAKLQEQLSDENSPVTQNALGNTETDLAQLESCERKLSEWNRQGFDTSHLETLQAKSVPSVLELFATYEQNISRLRIVKNRIQAIERSYPEFGKDPGWSARINSVKRALSTIDNPETAEAELRAIETDRENYLKTRKQKEEEARLAQEIADLQMRVKDRLAEAQKIGAVPENIVLQVTAQDISTLESALIAIDDFLKNARPALEVSLGTTQFTAGKWYKVGVILSNSGNAHAFDVYFSFSEEFETKRIKPTQVDGGKTVTVDIGLMPKNAGSIPFEITVHYTDGKARKYSETHEFWIEVIDSNGGLPAFDRSENRGISQKQDTSSHERMQPSVGESVQFITHHDVFITYSHKDKPVADAVCAALENNGIRCWIAPRDVLPGEDFPDAIIKAIDSSRIMVLIFSSNSNASPHVVRELTKAVSKGHIIIPFRIEDAPLSNSMEYLIGLPHWLDAISPPIEKHIDTLVKTVSAILNKRV